MLGDAASVHASGRGQHHLPRGQPLQRILLDAGAHLLTSVLFDYTGAYSHLIDQLAAGEFGEVYTMNLENQGVRLLEFPDTVEVETRTTVDDVSARIVSGEITVSAVGDADGVRTRLDELFPR